MTTADIMFDQPGNRTIDHEYDARAVLWALLAAILIHLVIAFLLAVFGGVLSPALPIEEKPAQLTFVDLSSAPVVPKNSAFIETDESKKSAAPPQEKTFESNANSIAASELPAAGEAPLPSQMGKDRPLLDLETHPHSLQMNGAQPQPSAAPQQNPKPSAVPQPTLQPAPLTAAEQFAMLTARPTPAVQPSTAPASAQSAYRALKERTRISGRITNRGIASVNALGTPLGRYQKFLVDAIGSRWYAFLDRQMDLINIGTTRVVFVVDRSGRVKNLKVVENTANEALANVCIQSIQEAQFPPMSDDLAATLPAEGLEMDIPFTIFANR
jgi:outer membrane biosynthesis protein TonB